MRSLKTYVSYQINKSHWPGVGWYDLILGYNLTKRTALQMDVLVVGVAPLHVGHTVVERT